MSVSCQAQAGLSPDGLKITVLPATSAADTIPVGIATGKFQGAITSPTPTVRKNSNSLRRDSCLARSSRQGGSFPCHNTPDNRLLRLCRHPNLSTFSYFKDFERSQFESSFAHFYRCPEKVVGPFLRRSVFPMQKRRRAESIASYT